MCAPPRAEKRSAMVAVVPGHTVHHNYHLSVNPLIERVCHEAGGTGERTHRRLGAPRGVPDHRLAGVRRGPGGRPPPLGSGVGVPQPQRPAGGGGAAGGAGGDGAERRGRGTAALATVPHGSYHVPPPPRWHFSLPNQLPGVVGAPRSKMAQGSAHRFWMQKQQPGTIFTQGITSDQPWTGPPVSGPTPEGGQDRLLRGMQWPFLGVHRPSGGVGGWGGLGSLPVPRAWGRPCRRGGNRSHRPLH